MTAYVQMLWGEGRRRGTMGAVQLLPMELPMSQHFRFDASSSLTALEQDFTIIGVIEMSQTKWLVAALVPAVERQPLKKFDGDEETLLKLLHRWRREADQAG
jgi:transposase